MVKNFKGVVKVADVQEEFDKLLTTINTKIDEYNAALNVGEDVDYNVGGPDLAPYGYTLSVGGLKTALNALDGCILGANVLRISNGNYVVSEGLYIKNQNAIRLPSKVVSGEGKYIFYDTENQRYSISNNTGGSGGLTTGNVYAYIEDVTGQAESYALLSSNTINNQHNANIRLCGGTFTPENLPWTRTTNVITLEWKNLLLWADYASETAGSMRYGEIPIVNLRYPSRDNSKDLTQTVSLSFDGAQDMGGGDAWGWIMLNANSVGESVTWNIVNFWPKDTINLKIEFDLAQGVARYYTQCINSYTGYTPIDEDYVFHSGSVISLGAQQLSGQVYLELKNYYESSGGSEYDLRMPINLGDITLNADGSTIFARDESIPVGFQLAKVNTNRLSRLCNTPEAVNESIPNYKVRIESKANDWALYAAYMNPDTSQKGVFYSGSAGRNCRINLFDTQVAYHQFHGDRNDSYWEPFNFMFIPKGIGNPYNSLAGETIFANQKFWNYNVERPGR